MAVEKRNILLTNITEPMKYTPQKGRAKKNIPSRDCVSHARNISKQYDVFIKETLKQKQVAAIKMKGMYAEFSGKKDFDLATKSLENRRAGIKLLNVQNIDMVTQATVYIPEGQEEYFKKRIKAYSTEKTKKTERPKNADLINSIDKIKSPVLLSFWTDNSEALPQGDAVNCEVWLRYEMKGDESSSWNAVEKEFHAVCDILKIVVNKEKRILFPERIVKVVSANRNELDSLLEACEFVAEIRRAVEPTSFFTDLENIEQKAWSEEALSRCYFSDTGVCVCLLDAGMNQRHPLLASAVLKNGLHAVNQGWGTGDNDNCGGHGTEMAGVAVYGDLQEVLESNKAITVRHKIESVKILPNSGANPPELYGSITQKAVALAEIANPDEKRVICMAVTADAQTEKSDDRGKPTSWSAALDEIASGAAEEDKPHRLFLVSAGNVKEADFYGNAYPEKNTIEMIDNPGQSWNAITVGGYANKIDIADDGFRGFSALAPRGALSPYSRTSVSWPKYRPIKPEVLFEGGNVATNDYDYDHCDDLSLLTTGHRPEVSVFSTIWGTSAATAQAANFSARLFSEYPDYWPETIRALMVHSAEWTDEMRLQFCLGGKDTTKGQRRNLLRACGYGIPNFERAVQCANNSVNMIVQGVIQPYHKVGKKKPVMNEVHIHTFPWPKEVLLALGSVQVKLKVTLSYFVEPLPGETGWKNRYAYPSCGLRFEINSPYQTLEEFKTKINHISHIDEDDEDSSRSRSTGNNWYLGPKNRDVGSIHSDFIFTNAAELCEMKYVAVYPVSGWWKDKAYLGCYENRIRYSLIVSLSTPETEVDLYTPIINQIKNIISVPVR